MFIWYALLSPLVIKLLKKHLNRKKSKYSGELENIIDLFPYFRKLINIGWQKSSDRSGVRKLGYFLSTSLVMILLVNIHPEYFD